MLACVWLGWSVSPNCFLQLADDLFDGIALTWHFKLSPCLNPTMNVGSAWGAGHTRSTYHLSSGTYFGGWSCTCPLPGEAFLFLWPSQQFQKYTNKLCYYSALRRFCFLVNHSALHNSYLNKFHRSTSPALRVLPSRRWFSAYSCRPQTFYRSCSSYSVWTSINRIGGNF